MKKNLRLISSLFFFSVIAISIFFIAQEPIHAENALESKSIIPTLKLQVPIDKLTEITSQELKEGRGIQTFIVAAYQWTLGFVMILAVLALTFAGLVWMTAAGGKERVGKAKEIIKNTLVGLVLAIGSYVILAALNPKLIELPALRLETVQKKELKITLLTKSCEDICQDAAKSKGNSWVSIKGEHASCTSGTEKRNNQILEVCTGSDPDICQCDLLVQTTGAPNCGTFGCAEIAYCNPSTNVCEDRKAVNSACTLSNRNECQKGLSCADDGSGTNRCRETEGERIRQRTGTCCYVATEHVNAREGTTNLSVAASKSTTYEDCKNVPQPTEPGLRPLYWTFCRTGGETMCGERVPNGAQPPVTLPNGTPSRGTLWKQDLGANRTTLQQNGCTLFRVGSTPELIH